MSQGKFPEILFFLLPWKYTADLNPLITRQVKRTHTNLGVVGNLLGEY